MGNDVYKIRLNIKSKGKGKRGGGRVLTQIKVEKEKVYLLSIYDKSEKDTISSNTINKLLEEIKFILNNEDDL